MKEVNENVLVWVTEIKAADKNGHLLTWAGPQVYGRTQEEAQAYCENNGLGYCKVIGSLVLPD